MTTKKPFTFRQVVMLSRKDNQVKGDALPAEWSENLAQLLNQNYEKECQKHDSHFEVFGQVYPEELILIVSFVSPTHPEKLPVTCFLSCEQEHLSTPKKAEQTQKDYIDMVGLFFDEVFSNEDWDSYEPLWQEVAYKDDMYLYKITRENIGLTIAASKLLGEDEF